MAEAARTDHDHLGTPRLDLVIAIAQLRGVLTAEQSAEVAREHENHPALGPEVAEPTHS